MVAHPVADQSSTTEAAIEERIARTRAIHAELMQLWEIDTAYEVTITLFPSPRLYAEIPEAEQVSGRALVKTIPTTAPLRGTAALSIGDDLHAWEMVAFHRPDEARP